MVKIQGSNTRRLIAVKDEDCIYDPFDQIQLKSIMGIEIEEVVLTETLKPC